MSGNEVHDVRDKIRRLAFLKSVAETYSAAHPEPDLDRNEAIVDAFAALWNGTKTEEEVAVVITSMHGDRSPEVRSRNANIANKRSISIQRAFAVMAIVLTVVVC